jgi:long-subunit acyl-CoA synthetase (AMP-forming)
MDVYVENPEATKNAFLKGWLDTGDVGYCDQGKWYVVGREKVRLL